MFNNVAALLHFVAPGQINAQVPWNVLLAGTQNGSVAVVVTSGGNASAPVLVSVGPFSPGIFALNYGVGNAIAINSDGSLAAPANSVPGVNARPALAGDSGGLVILATGLGALDSTPPNGSASPDKLRKTTTTPEVLIGGTSAPVAFSGASPQFVGVNQINVTVPSRAPGGDKVPLQLRIGGITTTDQVAIAVDSPASACVNISGTWVASEKGTLNCTLTANGQPVTEIDPPIDGVDVITISQQGCQVSYTSSSITAAFGSGKSVRQGTVAGSNVTFTGIMGQLAPVSLTKKRGRCDRLGAEQRHHPQRHGHTDCKRSMARHEHDVLMHRDYDRHDDQVPVAVILRGGLVECISWAPKSR